MDVASPATEPQLLAGKNLSVRLPGEHLTKVSNIAKIDDVTLGEVVRDAILVYYDKRMKDPELPARIEEVKRHLDEVLLPVRADM